MRLHTERARFLVENLDLQQATGIETARWEWFQLQFLLCDNVYAIFNKSRQVAASWIMSAEAVSTALLESQGSIFISINQNEAKEKIRYAREIYHAIKLAKLPKIVQDSQTRLEFGNGAIIESYPAKAPRGKSRFNLYADEYAHVRDDDLIYKGMLPVISKGGRIRMASTPMGASGVFWEIFTESLRPYSTYRRFNVPWWQTFAFCRDVRQAFKEAPIMPTEERVIKFGNPRLIDIFLSVALEDFQQEYECIFVDESTAWITWDEIKRNQKEHLLCEVAKCQGDEIGNAETAVRTVAKWVHANKIEQTLVAGMDIGRHKDMTELCILGHDGSERHSVRLMITLDRTPFERQMAVLSSLFKFLPIELLLIDKNGIGMSLAEDAQRLFGDRALGATFTNNSKKQWATRAKKTFQEDNISLPVHKDLAYQIHSIKRIISASRNLQFDTDANEKHHADKFWALALALASGARYAMQSLLDSNTGGSFPTYG